MRQPWIVGALVGAAVGGLGAVLWANPVFLLLGAAVGAVVGQLSHRST